VVGIALFHSGGGGVPTLSGTARLGTLAATERTVGSVLFVGWSMLGVAAIALFFSTLTESGLAATLGAISVLIASGVLQALDAARSIQPYLPTRYWLAFVDLFRQPILWRNVDRGIALQAVYVVVFLLLSWANFTTRDVKA
jgi:ABC-2 type transport system permease protein